MNRSLFDISADMRALEDLLYESGGELPDDAAEQALDSFFRELASERDAKLDNYAALVREKRARVVALKEEARRLAAEAAIEEAQADRLWGRLVWFFAEFNITEELRLRRCRLKLVNNGGLLPLVVRDGTRPEDLPERFQKRTVAIDNSVVRAALDAGEQLEFAHYAERGRTVRMK